MSIKAVLSAHASSIFPLGASPSLLDLLDPNKSPLHGVFVIGDKPEPRSDCPQSFAGDLVESLIAVAEQAEGQSSSSNRPQIIQPKDYGRDYFCLNVLPLDSTIHCSNVDCLRKARLLIDARDEDVLPFCAPCAYVAHAMWMAGV